MPKAKVKDISDDQVVLAYGITCHAAVSPAASACVMYL